MILASAEFPASSPLAVRRLFDAYVSRCEEILVDVFDAERHRVDDLRHWLYETVGPNDEAMTELIHHTPLYVVSEFLDLGGQNLSRYEARYLELAAARGWS
jgi:hypothetical protein